MAGSAKTNDFMLGTATVMIGAPEDLHNLNPAEHSIGLVKNFTLTSEPAYTELTQGVKNTIVHSVLTSNPVRATMEAYEYTAKNLAYSLGIEGADDVVAFTAATTISALVDGSPSSTSISVVSAVGLGIGNYIMIMVDAEDNFVVRKISNIVSNTITVDVPITQDIGIGAVVKKVNGIGIGSKTEQPFYAAKVAGVLANGEKVVLEIPKIRIIRGFNLAFSTENYGNLPIEFTVYDLVPTDPLYSNFLTESARLYKA